MTRQSALPRPMDEADVVREHDVHLSVDDGGAVHVEHDPATSGSGGSLLPKFPPVAHGAQAQESLAFYRQRCQTAMRVWVRFAFSDLASAPRDEQEAIQVAATLARLELGRPLWIAEVRLIGEAVRDVLTVQAFDAAAAREDKIRADEWTRDFQEGTR